METPVPGRYADPLTDFAFKRLFGLERSKPFLIDFLNALLNPDRKIVSIVYLNTEKLGNTRLARRSVFDIYCEDEEGNKFIIEMQRVRKPYFLGRAVFYSTFAVQGHAVAGDWDFNIRQTYAITLLEFCFDTSHPEQVVHMVKLVDTQTQQVFDDNLTYCYLEMPKFSKREAEVVTRLDQWLFVLMNMRIFTAMPVSLQDDPVFKRFFMEAEISNFNREEMYAYYASMKEKWDAYSTKMAIRQSLEEGKAQGIAEGIAEGKAQGIVEGLAEGKVEGEALGKMQEKYAIALQMKRGNEPIEKIAAYTDLGMQEIEQYFASLRSAGND